MGKHNVVALSGRDPVRDELTELIREGARKLIAEGLEAEVGELLAELSSRRDGAGRAAVVRNGYQPERDIQTGVGPVTVKVPKVRSRDGEPVSFHSALVPPYVRKSASLEAALPWLYLKGISTGEMAPALEVLVGAEAKGLSASTVSRLKQQWRGDYEAWRRRRLDKDRWVYVWADGIYSGLRADRQRLCSASVIAAFMAGSQIEADVTLQPSQPACARLRAESPDAQAMPLPLRLLKYEIGGSLFCLGTTLLDARRYPLHEFVDVYHSRWGIEELYKISKCLFVVEDFHARTARGVKQELFAHFVLITLNRLFANRADRELNPGPGAPACAPDDAAPPSRKTNFKNCMHVLERSLEELLLLHQQMTRVVQRVFRTILARHQRVRPNRSYVRRSMRPHTKWKLSKEKQRAQKAAATLLA